MKLISETLSHNEPVPGPNAFAIQGEGDEPIEMSDNRNPHFSWVDVPNEAKSLVLICHDPDVPSKPDDVNQPDREVPADLERMDFYHWVLVDIDPELEQIEEGAFSNGVTARGKDGPDAPKGTRQGINDYTNWFEGDPEMEGTYFGYDGPCPPWNDSIVHHYHFTLYATDLEEIDVSGEFTGDDVLDAIDGHILDQSKIVATYSLNPDVEA